VKCLWVDNKESKIKGLRGIIFLKYGKEFEVYASYPIFLKWTEALRGLVLINDLHAEYTVHK